MVSRFSRRVVPRAPKGDSPFVGECPHFIGLQNQRLARFHADYPNACCVCGVEGEGTDDGHVESKILVWFGNFYHDRVFSTEFTAPGDRRVRALECLDCENGARLDNDRLANVEPADFLRDMETVGEVHLLAAAETRAGDDSGSCELIIEKCRRREEIDAGLGQFIANRAEDRLGVSLLEAGEEEERFHIGAKIEEVSGRDLSGHDGVVCAARGEEGNHAPQLADAEPLHVVYFTRERRVGFSLERRHGDSLHTCSAGSPYGGERIGAVAGDEGEG